MPSLSHSPLASYNTKKTLKKYIFDIFVNVKFILSFFTKKADLTEKLLKRFGLFCVTLNQAIIPRHTALNNKVFKLSIVIIVFYLVFSFISRFKAIFLYIKYTWSITVGDLARALSKPARILHWTTFDSDRFILSFSAFRVNLLYVNNIFVNRIIMWKFFFANIL